MLTPLSDHWEELRGDSAFLRDRPDLAKMAQMFYMIGALAYASTLKQVVSDGSPFEALLTKMAMDSELSEWHDTLAEDDAEPVADKSNGTASHH